ncbi:MAG: DeoR/GlpR family transcriptional regulator of sugar metabolism [Pseudoalteromonas tetraodonis]|jgi:DeoR/GlpR family transcriptional regulator of sugar metabolism
MKSSTVPSEPTIKPAWSFLTNHGHLLVCLSRESMITVRNLSLQVGITQRFVQRILSELDEAGVVTRSKQGRCYRYNVDLKFCLRHPLEQDKTIGELLGSPA